MREAGTECVQGLDISIVLVLLTSRTIFFMQLSNNIGVDITFPLTSFKHRGFLGCCSKLFYRSKKKNRGGEGSSLAYISL